MIPAICEDGDVVVVDLTRPRWAREFGSRSGTVAELYDGLFRVNLPTMTVDGSFDTVLMLAPVNEDENGEYRPINSVTFKWRGVTPDNFADTFQAVRDTFPVQQQQLVELEEFERDALAKIAARGGVVDVDDFEIRGGSSIHTFLLWEDHSWEEAGTRGAMLFRVHHDGAINVNVKIGFATPSTEDA